jgi:hypothetical protein
MPNTTDALIKSVTSDYLSFPVERVHVDTLDEKSFLLRYVVTRRPVLLIGAVDHWLAIKLWSDPSSSGFNRMANLCKDSVTSLQCTPDGKGDCVKDGLFVKPMDRRLRFSDALERINAYSRTRRTIVKLVLPRKSRVRMPDDCKVLLQAEEAAP